MKLFSKAKKQSMPTTWISISKSLEISTSLNDGKEVDAEFKEFNASKLPLISIKEYIERLHKYCRCSNSCLIMGYIYINRILLYHPKLILTPLNVHR